MSGIELYWLPLGAGDRVVARFGALYERLVARRERRPSCDIYHAALAVIVDGRRHAIEMVPVWKETAPDRGVVCEGPVALRWLGRSRWFRYEARCWPDGSIPDLSYAVDSPVVVSSDGERALAALESVRTVPALTWGRDELGCGDMWNSNSLVSYVLIGAGVDATDMRPTAGGRAPGWQAGLTLAGSSDRGVGTQSQGRGD